MTMYGAGVAVGVSVGGTGGVKVAVGVAVSTGVGVGVKVGRLTAASTVNVAIWAGESWPTGEGVQVGAGGNDGGTGVGVGSPTNICPSEQATLLLRSKAARITSQMMWGGRVDCVISG